MARRRKKGFGSSAEEHRREAAKMTNEAKFAISQGEMLLEKGYGCDIALSRFRDAAYKSGIVAAEMEGSGVYDAPVESELARKLINFQTSINEKCFKSTPKKGGR